MQRTRFLVSANKLAAITLATLAIAGGLALSGGRAHATVMVEIPMEDLVRDADAIVLGTVERVGVRLQMDAAQRGMDPHTITTIRVESWLKGSGDDRVTIDELGGVMGELGLRIDGTPRYRTGERVVVFLHRVEGRYRTLQMAQGAFEVLPGVPGAPSIVQRDLEAIGLARWTDGQMTIEHGGRSAMRLDDFLSYLRATLRNLAISTPDVPASAGADAVGGAR